MPGTTGRETTTWFSTETATASPSTTQYKLTGSYSIDPAESPKQPVVDAIVATIEPASEQTTLTLYDYLEPDALDDLVKASADKRSHVEVRFTFEAYLVVVRSTGTILVYEPL